jgi:hypothetical protein
MRSLTIGFLVAAALSVSGCGLDGPSDKQVEELARAEMIKNLGVGDAAQKTAMAAIAQAATISKKGICNSMPDKVYACMVDVTIKVPGTTTETTQTMVVQAKKDADGTWKSVN